MSEADMVDVMVSERRRDRAWPWAVALLAVILIAVAFIVPLPIYLEGPGLSRSTEDNVFITGRESYDSDGQILYTTVSQRRAVTASWLASFFDDTIDRRSEDEVTPTGNREEERRVSQAQMDRSKLTALVVAFSVLDLPLTIEGEGALVQAVAEDSPALDRLEPGDVITATGTTPVTTSTGLRESLAEFAPGDTVTLTVTRAEAPVEVTTELMAAPDDETRGILGIEVQTFNESVDTGFGIELDSGSVIGPSAGLAWTLGVIDRLSPGDLTHGEVVAVTGTIYSDGSVGAVGGIEKKVVAAMRGGATLFLYPEESADDAVEKMKKAADGKIELHAVATVEDALAVLDPDGLGASPAS